MGHLTPQNFTGRLGTETIAAIKAFQKANGLPKTGTFTDVLTKKVYEVAGKKEPPEGHLFVRQDFARVFDMPVSFRNPQQALGTHVFTAMKFARGDAKVQWMGIGLEAVDSAGALDRIAIPDDVRQKISARLTPGSSLIIADTSINAAILPEGDDFLVLAKATPAKVDKPKVRQAPTKSKKAKVKRAKVAPAVTKPRTRARRRRSTKRRHDRPQTVGRRGLYWR
jgi:peptidoglycan hydrolase-like protein with peptidoglycan-binding domain